MGETNGKIRNGIYVRRNALRDNGWIAVLTKNELQIWEAYDSHADASGVAFPDSDRLSKYMGHKNNNNVPRIRQRLIEYGLLEIVEPGGGRGHPCKVRVLIPGKNAPEKKVKSSDVKALKNSVERLSTQRAFMPNKGSQKSGERLSNSVAKGSQNGESLNKEEQAIEHTKNTPARGGLLQTQIGGGYGDTEAEIKSQVYNANIEWALTGLAPHLTSPKFRTSLAAFALHLHEIEKLTGTSWRKKLETLGKMTEQRAIAALEYSLCGGYQQIVEPPASRTRDSPQREHNKPLDKAIQHE